VGLCHGFWATATATCISVWAAVVASVCRALRDNLTYFVLFLYTIYHIRVGVGFYKRDTMLAQVIVIATCPSVRLSVTCRYCVKTKKASVMIS